MTVHEVSGNVAVKSGSQTAKGGPRVIAVGVKPDYRTAHRKVAKYRGKARDHVCVDGGDHQADQWSYNPGDEFEVTGTTPVIALRTRKVYSSTVTFSMSIHAYSPRCRAHHVAADVAHRKASR